MAKVQNPVIGRAKASAGSMTFTKNHDKNVMRAKAFEVSNPKTAAQTNQRTFFALVAAITQSVSDAELRSLFGQKPKGMSRRNMLSKQIASAYSVVDGQKVVDFSKLQAIGNGQACKSPFIPIVNGIIESGIVFSPEMFQGFKDGVTNTIIVVFDNNSNSIKILNTDKYLCVDVWQSEDLEILLEDYDGYCYVTCATNGEDVSELPFGSFTIKTRQTQDNANASSDTPREGDTITFESGAAATDGILNFANYDFNNLLPGDVYTEPSTESTQVFYASDWQDFGNNEYNQTLASPLPDVDVLYVQVLQGDSPVAWVPFAVVMQ